MSRGEDSSSLIVGGTGDRTKHFESINSNQSLLGNETHGGIISTYKQRKIDNNLAKAASISWEKLGLSLDIDHI